jgi:hypothetical protein
MDSKDYKKKMVRRAVSVEEPCDKAFYQSQLGSAMYLMPSTRPDICFTVGAVSRFSSDRGISDIRGMDGLLGYLAGTKHLRLRSGGTDGSGGMSRRVGTELGAYAESDYPSSGDYYRSPSGYAMIYGGGGAID